MNNMNRRNFLKTAGKFTLVGVTTFTIEHVFLGLAISSFRTDSIIEIGNCKFKATKGEVKTLKEILDKLGQDYILDDVQFNLTEPTVNLLKAVYEVDFWKVEGDGSVSLKSMYGHSGTFEYKKIWTDKLPEINERTLKWMSAKLNDIEVKILRDLSEKIAILDQ